MDRKKAFIEALLFATEGLTLDKIKERSKIQNEEEVLRILQELQMEYEERKGGMIIVNEGNVWKMKIRDEFTHDLKDFVPCEFPKSILETLAVIAWKMPVKQSDVVRIRGNKAYEHISKLIENGFVSGERHGKTLILKLTDKFYQYFDICRGEEKNLLNKVQVNKEGE